MDKSTAGEQDAALYDVDFYAWTQSAAEGLRLGRLPEPDIENVAEEIEDMGKRDRRELYSRMRVLIQHLMKWAVQTDRRSSSWTDTISEQRAMIDGVLEQSPSLRPHAMWELPAIFRKAADMAARETGLPVEAFRGEGQTNLDLDRLLDVGFLPEHMDDLVR